MIKEICFHCRFCERCFSSKNAKFPTYAHCMKDIKHRIMVEEDDLACKDFEEKEKQNGD